jgi:WD40 repeat protein
MALPLTAQCPRHVSIKMGPDMRTRRISIALSFLAFLTLAGCNDPSSRTVRGESTITPASAPADDDARNALKRTEAELAASRAQVDELRRIVDAQAKKQDETTGRGSAASPSTRDFTILARQRLHDCYISSIAFSPDGKHLASADINGRVLVSNANDLQPVLGVEAITGEGVHNGTSSVCFSPDGKLIAVGSEDRTLWVWRTADGQLLNRIRGHEGPVEHVFFLPDSNSGISFDRQGTGLTWSMDEHFTRQSVPTRRMRHAAMTPDGKTLVWSDGSRTLSGPPDEKEAAALGTFADAVAITRDGALVAKGSSNYCVEVWDVKYELKKWSSTPLPSKVQSLKFTPDRKRLVSLVANTISIWDVRTGDETLRTRVRSNDLIGRLAMSPDGRTIAMSNHQGLVILARLPEEPPASRDLVFAQAAHEWVRFSSTTAGLPPGTVSGNSNFVNAERNLPAQR